MGYVSTMGQHHAGLGGRGGGRGRLNRYTGNKKRPLLPGSCPLTERDIVAQLSTAQRNRESSRWRYKQIGGGFIHRGGRVARRQGCHCGAGWKKLTRSQKDCQGSRVDDQHSKSSVHKRCHSTFLSQVVAYTSEDSRTNGLWKAQCLEPGLLSEYYLVCSQLCSPEPWASWSQFFSVIVISSQHAAHKFQVWQMGQV